jgi:uncharacterized membrane protein
MKTFLLHYILSSYFKIEINHHGFIMLFTYLLWSHVMSFMYQDVSIDVDQDVMLVFLLNILIIMKAVLIYGV